MPQRNWQFLEFKKNSSPKGENSRMGVVTNLYFLSALMTLLVLILKVSSLVVICHVFKFKLVYF